MNGMLPLIAPLKAVVKNGRIVVDEPTDLPEGMEFELVPLDEEDREDHALLMAAIDEGIEDAEQGNHMDGFEFIAQLRAKREAPDR